MSGDRRDVVPIFADGGWMATAVNMPPMLVELAEQPFCKQPGCPHPVGC